MHIKNLILSILFGKPIYNIQFVKIECRENTFIKQDRTDLRKIKKFGLAINSAEKVLEKNWVLTDENNLICWDFYENDIPYVLVKINIEENASVMRTTKFLERIKEGNAFPVRMEGLTSMPKREGVWCIFLSDTPRSG
jgi:hypothetical protein